MPTNRFRIHPRAGYIRHKRLFLDCIFCSPHRIDNIILNTKYWSVQFSAFPFKQYHVVLIPHRHVESFRDLKILELSELQKLWGILVQSFGQLPELEENKKKLFISIMDRELIREDQSLKHLHVNFFVQGIHEIGLKVDSKSHKFNASAFATIIKKVTARSGRRKPAD